MPLKKLILTLVVILTFGLLYLFTSFSCEKPDPKIVTLVRYKYKPVYSNFYPKISCSLKDKPNVRKSDVNTSAFLSYPTFTNKQLQKRIAERQHGNFMPLLNIQQKLELMYLYLIIRDAFISRKIEHFLVDGTVLGIYRHGGLVPWDHDIDLGVFVDHRKEVDDALSCIHGLTLAWSAYRNNFHATFTFTGREVPLIDLYFYGLDDHYVYGLNSKQDMNYPWRSVFPLHETFVEGIPFYVPHDIAAAATFQYDPKICRLGSILYPVNKTWAKGYPDAFSLTSVDCSELTYMYNFKTHMTK